ncbi:helix-turn-helix transcriptional regulator [Christiangramia sp. SM2212]|uniref:Helix-turn-helix transcriptional regulator n=1 Tax=Christiangramia sediminicola TaxID=3073267 RepID=A0ABU1EKW4_9FLAO|nr:helix-turn-helix transcriptional regulator [Christiangramia sp. SM2212]MDR5589025.1 helix-turn-helix transcriptional regulator [Christiangramia sp. SM2212]
MEHNNIPNIINSITELHKILGLPKPTNPLITLIDHSQEREETNLGNQKMLLNFYNITIKRSFQGQLKYGKTHYDFDEGTMSFLSPNQVFTVDEKGERNKDGWSLLFHPDLIANYGLSKSIKTYGFFSYGVNEALHLSDKEEKTIESSVQNIQEEYNSTIDLYSQDEIVSNLELLLNYCNRFYNRQFITRKMASNDLLVNFESKLSEYFDESTESKLPTVRSIADEMNVSPNYLRDMLRAITGQNTQQHIHAKLIEKAKEYLTTTSKSIGEIAFQLGFEHSQSFNRLFKNKTDVSPLAYRNSFN